jgi:signal transduction histidine kinase
MMREIYEESVMVDERHCYRFADNGQKLYVEADPALLKQAVRILVDNAAKYTRDGDEIILSYGKTEDDLPFLLVQDTGIGMAEADVAHMFERFYRADDVRGQEGTGLGLSIAKWIVDKHGGHFEVLSRTELGTRIRIVLS